VTWARAPSRDRINLVLAVADAESHSLHRRANRRIATAALAGAAVAAVSFTRIHPLVSAVAALAALAAAISLSMLVAVLARRSLPADELFETEDFAPPGLIRWKIVFEGTCATSRGSLRPHPTAIERHGSCLVDVVDVAALPAPVLESPHWFALAKPYLSVEAPGCEEPCRALGSSAGFATRTVADVASAVRRTYRLDRLADPADHHPRPPRITWKYRLRRLRLQCLLAAVALLASSLCLLHAEYFISDWGEPRLAAVEGALDLYASPPTRPGPDVEALAVAADGAVAHSGTGAASPRPPAERVRAGTAQGLDTDSASSDQNRPWSTLVALLNMLRPLSWVLAGISVSASHTVLAPARALDQPLNRTDRRLGQRLGRRYGWRLGRGFGRRFVRLFGLPDGRGAEA
jgi:hypothetical protein